MPGVYFPVFFRITPFVHLLRHVVLKTQQISHTDSHATLTDEEAYNSVPVYLLITSVSFATSIGTARITFCQSEVMKNMLKTRVTVKSLKTKIIKRNMIKRKKDPT